MTEEQSSRKVRVLVVEDEEAIREGIGRALARRGCAVQTAGDGFEAGYQMAAFKPEVVLLDIVMPGMGGFDVCERMRRMRDGEKLKIIILTGFGGSGNNEQSLISGADLFLTKPQDTKSLMAHIEDILGD